jgi:hypothetical protein
MDDANWPAKRWVTPKVECFVPEENSISNVLEDFSRERMVNLLGRVIDRKKM